MPSGHGNQRRLWANANLNNVFFFQQEIIAPTLTELKFSIKNQTTSQRKLIVDLGHQKVVACDATFVTNDKKVL
jgi:hypothetical protein